MNLAEDYEILVTATGLSTCGGDAGSLWPLFATLHFELDSLAFIQCLETFPFDNGKMYEHIRATIRGGNKTITFGFVEPFYGTCIHVTYLTINQ